MYTIHYLSTSESLSNKAGNATNGAVGDQTLLNQATTLASHSLDYAKGVVGIGAAKPASSVDDAAHNAQGESGSHTLGDLVSEGRNLAASVLHTAQTVVASGADKAKDVGGDVQDSNASGKPVGYVVQARDLAASALATAESYVAAGTQKVNEVASTTSTNDIKASAQQTVDNLSSKAEDAKARYQNTTREDVKSAAGDLLDKADAKKTEAEKQFKA